MSYCRWSTDDFQCDLYVYEDCSGGYTTHVAENRVIYKEPLPAVVPLTPGTLKEWHARHEKVYQMLHNVERAPIGLPHDGETFNDDTPEELLDRITRLIDMGYRCPPSVLEAIREEAGA